MSKSNKNGLSGEFDSTANEFSIRQPPKKKSLRELIYDSKKGRILGRTPKSWVLLLVFYASFYTVLASLFIICMQGLFLTLSDDYPKWQMGESVIGTNPGLGFRPLPDNVDEESSILYTARNQTEVEIWTKRLDAFLVTYRNKSKLPNGGKNQVVCDFDQIPNNNSVCAVEVDNWGPCSPNEGYSYNKSTPCIFLKLNRIYNWMPEFYTKIEELPEKMPEELKNYIANTPEERRQQIWVSCDGKDHIDKENVENGFEYYPKELHGFPSYFYPYSNTPGYLSPLVAIRQTKIGINQILNIECKAWAKNIKIQGGRDRMGSVHFEVMIKN